MTGIFEWSETAAANASADSEINWSEGQPANTVNNSARAMMRRVRQLLDDQFGALVTAGTGNAYTVTTKTGIVTLRDGYGFLVRADRTNTGACTMNPDAKGALPWRDERGNELQSGDIIAEAYYPVYYHSSDTTYRTRLQASRSNPHGGAVLEYTDASTITLKPKQDGFLRVGGAAKSIPAGGITGLAAGKQTPIASTNSVGTGTAVTLTLGATHSFVAGQKVLVIGAPQSYRDDNYVGVKTLTGVTGTTITYASSASLSSAADTNLTVIGIWYVYAYDANNDGVLDTLDMSATGHVTDAFGVETKSGDGTRVLVGMVAIGSSGGTPIFQMDGNHQYVRSFYNRSKSLSKAKATSQIVTGSPTTLETQASALRTYVLTWADDLVVFDIVSDASMSGSGFSELGFSVDGPFDQDSSTRFSGTPYMPAVSHYRGQLAEGLHAVGVAVQVSAAGNTAFIGAGAESQPSLRHFLTLYGAVL